MSKWMGRAALAVAFAAAMTSMMGCMSYVKVYDSEDHLVGSCTSGSKLFGVIPFAWGNSGCLIKTLPTK